MKEKFRDQQVLCGKLETKVETMERELEFHKAELDMLGGRKDGITRDFVSYKQDEIHHKLSDEMLLRQIQSKMNILTEENLELK